jgi:hypothetical protein
MGSADAMATMLLLLRLVLSVTLLTAGPPAPAPALVLAPTQPSCAGGATTHSFAAVAYSPTRGLSSGSNATIRHYPSIAFAAVLGQGGWEDRYFGDLANVTVPCLRWGECDPRCRRSSGPGAPAGSAATKQPSRDGSCGNSESAPNGTESLAQLFPGRVVVRFYSADDLRTSRVLSAAASPIATTLDFLPLRNASRCAAFCGNATYPLAGPHNACHFRGVWWDEGVAQLRQQVTKFFAAYRAAGGTIDEIVQDSEVGLTTFALFDWFGDPANATVHECNAERWDTMAADLRWPPILAQLHARGFVATPAQGAGYLAEAMRFSVDQSSQYVQNRIIFNTLMTERAAAYWNTALFEPARHSLPAVRYSDWADSNCPYQYRDPTMCMPSGNGDLICNPPNGTQIGKHQIGGNQTAIIGNVETGMFYGGFSNTADWAAPGANASLRKFWGVNRQMGQGSSEYPFNSFRWQLTQGRGTLVGISDLKLPGLAFKAWVENVDPTAWPAVPQFCQDSHYQSELLVHLYLAGMDGLYLFNPFGNGGYEGYEFVESLHTLLDTLVGCAARQAIVDRALRFEDSFVLTGMEAGTLPAQQVWRFTPRLPLASGVMMPSVLVKSTEIGVRIGPVRLAMHGGRYVRCTVVFAGGQVVESGESLLPFGVWVVQRQANGTRATPLQLECEDKVARTWPLAVLKTDDSAFALKSDDKQSSSYDGSWSHLSLPGGARQEPICAALNRTHAIFAGGYGKSNYTAAVDICSATACSSASDTLSRRNGAMGVATLPDHQGVVYAGGEAASGCKGSTCESEVYATADVFAANGSRVLSNQSALSEARYEVATVQCGGYVYAVGGAAANADGTKLASSTIDVMDPRTLQWRALTERLKTARYQHAAACVATADGTGHTLLVAGGNAGGTTFIASVEGFTVQTDGSLKSLPREPDPLMKKTFVFCGAQAGDRAIFLGGVGSAIVHWYDATGRLVHAGTVLDGPVYRHVCVAAVVDKRPVVCAVGGCLSDPIIYGQIQCFFGDGTRHPVATNLSVARYSLGAAAVTMGDQMAIIAGGGIGPVAGKSDPHSCSPPNNVCAWTAVVDVIPL